MDETLPKIDLEGYSVPKLIVWTISDIAAAMWGVSVVTSFSIQDALGSSSDVVLAILGLIGVVSLVLTWTDIGPEVR